MVARWFPVPKVCEFESRLGRRINFVREISSLVFFIVLIRASTIDGSSEQVTRAMMSPLWCVISHAISQ